VRLEVDDEAGGAIVATAFDTSNIRRSSASPTPTPISSPAKPSRSSCRAIAARRHGVHQRAGQSGLARFVKLPPVEEKKISEIVKFEAKQQIPFSLDEVVWDYQKISSGLVTDGFASTPRSACSP